MRTADRKVAAIPSSPSCYHVGFYAVNQTELTQLAKTLHWGSSSIWRNSLCAFTMQKAEKSGQKQNLADGAA